MKAADGRSWHFATFGRMSAFGTSRQFIAMHQFGRYRRYSRPPQLASRNPADQLADGGKCPSGIG
jgi:hypothetical protein